METKNNLDSSSAHFSEAVTEIKKNFFFFRLSPILYKKTFLK